MVHLISPPNPKENISRTRPSAAPVADASHHHRERSCVVSVFISSVLISSKWIPCVCGCGYALRKGIDGLVVWFRVSVFFVQIGELLVGGIDSLCASFVSFSLVPGPVKVSCQVCSRESPVCGHYWDCFTSV